MQYQDSQQERWDCSGYLTHEDGDCATPLLCISKSSCCTQKWHMRTMVNRFQLAVVNIFKILVSLWTNQSKCTYTIFMYDNKHEISTICASSEPHLIYNLFLIISTSQHWRQKQMLISSTISTHCHPYQKYAGSNSTNLMSSLLIPAAMMDDLAEKVDKCPLNRGR